MIDIEHQIRMCQANLQSEETPHHSPYTRWMILALAVAGAIGAGGWWVFG